MTRGALLLSCVAACTAFTLIPRSAECAPKNDHLILANGDKLTGTVKELSKGKLRLKTDSMSSVYIEWDDIKQISTDHDLQIEMESGLRYFGQLRASDVPDLLQVARGDTLIGLYKPQVVAIEPIEGTFWGRVDGSVSLGFSYTKASDVAQFTLSGNAKYTSRRNRVNTALSSIITAQGDERDISRRNDLTFGFMRLLIAKWFASSGLSFQQNDELSLEHRVALTAAAGRFLVKTNSSLFSASLGASVNREKSTTAEPATFNAEGLVSVSYEIFRYDHPQTDLTSSINFYPSFTVEDRYRVDGEGRIRQELVTDLFVDFKLFGSLDTKPPDSQSGEATDYGTVLSIGYSF